LIKEIRVIHGVPQPIYKIPLKNVPDEGFFGAEPAEIVDRIIIGPTEYASATFQAFEELFRETGVDDPGARIFVSDIPLR